MRQTPTSSSRPSLPHNRERHVHWNEEEWRKFAYNLHSTYPHCDFLHSQDMAGLTVAMLQNAVKGMPPDRVRQFYTTTNVKPKLSDAFARALKDHDPLFVPWKAADTTNVVALPAATVAEAQRRQHRRQEGPQQKIRWDKNEWQLLAAELQRMYPARNFYEADVLAKLTFRDLRQAQQILPLDRQRHTLATMSTQVMQRSLGKAFNSMPPIPAAPEQVGTPMALPVPVVAAATATALPVAADSPNPWEAAFKPLVTLLATEMMAQVEQRLRSGELAHLLVQSLQALAPGLAAPASGAPSATTTPATQAQLASLATPKTEQKVRKFRIGIYGARDRDEALLQEAYPFFDILCVKAHQQIDRLRGCDRVYMMTSFVNHSGADKLKTLMKGDVTYCNGGLSDMKRLLHGLQHDLQQHKVH